jgi:hypothetical protein
VVRQAAAWGLLRFLAHGQRFAQGRFKLLQAASSCFRDRWSRLYKWDISPIEFAATKLATHTPKGEEILR